MDDVREEEEEEEEEGEEEEVGKDVLGREGSKVGKTEKFCSREERGKEGGGVSTDPLSKVMISLRWTWSG